MAPAKRDGPASISRRKRLVFWLFLAAVNVVFLITVYLGVVILRTRSLYLTLKSNPRGWSGQVHQANAELGFTPIPGGRGAEVLPLGPDLPVRFDRDGFRIPVSDSVPPTQPRTGPVVLTLGCSFTYGAATLAEDTYPYLVGRLLGGTTRNAGVSSYGLAQMLILARKLVATHKPDYVIVQYSPWLTARAQNPFAPTYLGKLPVPYFSGAAEPALQPPVFRARLMDRRVEGYRTSRQTVGDFAAFFWRVGLPLHLHDDVHMVLFHLARILGLLPSATAEGKRIERLVYGEIARVAQANHARMLIVVLGHSQDPVPLDPTVFPPDVPLVDAQGALIARLPAATALEYQRHYAHWRGTPPRVVDQHPNATAHRVIAEALVARIKRLPALRVE